MKQSLATSLSNLQTSHIDSLLLHSPLPGASLYTAWSTLESFVSDGRVKQIGISNVYDFGLLKSLWEKANVKPAVVQNRFYKESGYDVEIRRYCREKGIEWVVFCLTGLTASTERNRVSAAEYLTTRVSQIPIILDSHSQLAHPFSTGFAAPRRASFRHSRGSTLRVHDTRTRRDAVKWDDERGTDEGGSEGLGTRCPGVERA